jgi:hypothetical protein
LTKDGKNPCRAYTSFERKVAIDESLVRVRLQNIGEQGVDIFRHKREFIAQSNIHSRAGGPVPWRRDGVRRAANKVYIPFSGWQNTKRVEKV